MDLLTKCPIIDHLDVTGVYSIFFKFIKYRSALIFYLHHLNMGNGNIFVDEPIFLL